MNIIDRWKILDNTLSKDEENVLKNFVDTSEDNLESRAKTLVQEPRDEHK